MIETIEDDVVAHLASNVPSLIVNQNVRRGLVVKASDNQSLPGAVPPKCVFVLATGGASPVTYHSNQASIVNPDLKQGEDLPTVQVLIRSNPKAYSDGAVLAIEVFRALDRNPPVGYFDAQCLSSMPLFLGDTEENCYQWTINVLLKVSR